jgi:hypothetical protein
MEPFSAAVPLSEGLTAYYSLSTFPIFLKMVYII